MAGDAESVKSGMPTDEFVQALSLACDTARVVLDRRRDPNVWLTFFHAEGEMEHVENSFPWTPLVNLLNTLLSLSSSGADAKVSCWQRARAFGGGGVRSKLGPVASDDEQGRM